MEQTLNLPDPTTLSPEERIAAINAYRERVNRDEEIPREELRYAIALLRADRQSRPLRERSKKKREAVTPLSVEEL